MQVHFELTNTVYKKEKNSWFQSELDKSSHQRCSVKKTSNSIKKRLKHRCFLVKLAKFLRMPIFKNTYRRPLMTRQQS